MTDGFGLDNLPYGAVARPGERAQLAARIGDEALLLAPLTPDLPLDGETLNPLLALGRPAWDELRETVREAATKGAETIPLADLEPRLPVAIGDYVDFYSSLEHATNLGRLFRPTTDPLLPNWRHLPVGYHGRASSVVISGTPIRRPHGQLPDRAARPRSGRRSGSTSSSSSGSSPAPATPSARASRPRGARPRVWLRARQRLERARHPALGVPAARPVPGEVVRDLDLALGRAARRARAVPGAAPPQEPPPLDYLKTTGDWALDIALEVELNGEVISRTNARGLYWTFPQQLAHATVNGTNVRPGDLYASGTISGPEPGSEGSLIEQGRPFLQDGDTVVLRGNAGDRVSFGEVAGTITR